MKEKSDILFLCQFFYPEYVSSATLPYDTAKALVSKGFNVEVLCGYPKEYSKQENIPLEEVVEGIKIKRLKYLTLSRKNFLGRIINYFSFTFSVFIRFFSLKNTKSIIVYSNPPLLPYIAALASKFFKTKMVFVSYDIYPEIAEFTGSISRNGFISKLMKYINKTVSKYVDKIVVLSSEMKNFLIKNRKNLNSSSIIVIPNWFERSKSELNIDEYVDSKKRFDFLNLKEDIIISYFGNLGVCQDMQTILDAMRKLRNEKNIKFLFAGHGNKMQELKKIINEEKLFNSKVLNFLHGEDFEYALSISDCFLVSLEKNVTGLAVPSKTYSYMAASKPIISIMGKDSDISRDILESNGGFAIEVGESDLLVKSIMNLKNEPILIKKMGRNIHRIYEEKYTKKICTDYYIDMFTKLLEEM